MIEPAQLYEDRIRYILINTWYTSENMYWISWLGDDLFTADSNNIKTHQFVSVNKDGEILGL